MKSIEDEFRQAPPDWQKGIRGHLRMESMAQLLSEPEPALEWLIEGLWTDKSRGLIAGHPGVGKTWLALDMLLSVVTGTPCLGQFTVKNQGAALLIEEEASRLNLQRRIHCLARGRGLKDSDLTSLYHITRQFAKVPRDTKEITEIVKANNIKLVVFDSLRRMHNANENSSSEMQAILDSFAMISSVTSASVILIHHLAKSSKDDGTNKTIFERMRGSGDLWAWRDCIIAVEGEEDAEIANLSFQFRDAETPLPIAIKRLVNVSTGAITLEAIEPDFAEKIELITAYMKTQYGALSKNKIVAGIKGKRIEILRILRYMEKKQMIIENGSGFTLNDVPY